jgi:hypothetical protein
MFSQASPFLQNAIAHHLKTNGGFVGAGMGNGKGKGRRHRFDTSIISAKAQALAPKPPGPSLESALAAKDAEPDEDDAMPNLSPKSSLNVQVPNLAAFKAMAAKKKARGY